MEKIKVTLINQLGLHARPAHNLVKLAKKFSCKLDFYKNGKEDGKKSCKSILGIMGVEAKYKDELIFEAEGDDEKEAIKTIKEFIENGCGEVI